jgi:hypothetical protein
MRTLIAIAAVVLGVATPAHAACVKSDLAGRWATYILILPQLERPASWVRCQLRISRVGVVRDTTCRTSEKTSVALTGGRIRLANDRLCTFKGRLTLNDDVHTIEHMTLATNNFTATGVGNTMNSRAQMSVFLLKTLEGSEY